MLHNLRVTVCVCSEGSALFHIMKTVSTVSKNVTFSFETKYCIYSFQTEVLTTGKLNVIVIQAFLFQSGQIIGAK